MMYGSGYNQMKHIIQRFTDFFLVMDKSQSPLLLVEVKKLQINTVMVESICVAHVLQEVHIVLCEGGKVAEICPSFLPTQVCIWAFGFARRNGKKKTVQSTY